MKKKIALLFLSSLFMYATELPLQFFGNVHVDDSQLYGALNLHKPSFYEFYKKEPTLDTKALKLAIETIKSFYKTKGFYHAAIKSKKSKSKIVLYIQEKRPVRVELFTVISKFDLSSLIPFKKGVIFQSDKFIQSKREIKRFYKNRGYCQVNLYAKAWIDIKRDKAYLAYEAKENKPCHFEGIKINAPKSIDAKIIKSLLYFKKGDIYSLEKIKQSYKSLYANEGIANVVIKTDIQDGFDVNAIIDISQTQKPIRFQVGGGINSDEGPELSLGVKNSNFLGNLKTIGISTKYLQLKQSALIDFNMPLEQKKIFGASLEYSNEEFLGFKQQMLLETLFLKHRKADMAFQESLLFDYSSIRDSDDLAAYPQGDFFLISPKISWVYDTRDDMLDPTKGYFIRAELMGSVRSSFSDATYYKYSLEAAYILPLLPSIVALKINYNSLHVSDGSLPASYRFYAGGMKSNRAYNYRKLGYKSISGEPIGLNCVLGSTLEYRFKISKDIRGVLFSDNTLIGLNDTPDFSKIYSTLGFGFRYKTPIGPLALDFGFDTKRPTKQYAIHFRIGELF